MTEQGQDLVQQIQEQVQQSAEDFLGDSLGAIKNQLDVCCKVQAHSSLILP